LEQRESVSRKHAHIDHKALATLVKDTYARAAYDGGVGLDRLEELFEKDFKRVYAMRGEGRPFPSGFSSLAPFVGECLSKIGEARDAVLVLNNETKEQTPDFDKQSVWKILVGGTKLSRGYTVEGLTISYYRLIDLFAGAGGMTLGFTHRKFCGGFESVLSIDNDQAAVNIVHTLDLHFGRTPTDKSLARYSAVPPGGNRFDLQRNAPEITPQCWIRKKSGGTDLFGRLWWDRPSVTIRTEFFKPEKGRYLHPVENRPITHREAARLQGFPDTFRFCGTKIEIARQIGNAVPPPLAGCIARVVKALLLETHGTRKNLVKKPRAEGSQQSLKLVPR